MLGVDPMREYPDVFYYTCAEMVYLQNSVLLKIFDINDEMRAKRKIYKYW